MQGGRSPNLGLRIGARLDQFSPDTGKGGSNLRGAHPENRFQQPARHPMTCSQNSTSMCFSVCEWPGMARQGVSSLNLK